jgi:hypothetical protein
MIDFELEELRQNEWWLVVLRAYQASRTPRKAEEEAVDNWLERVRDVAGVDRADLSRIHGKLIALGLLKFQLEGRMCGVRYQLSASGKRLLSSPAVVDRSAEPTTDDGPQRAAA